MGTKGVRKGATILEFIPYSARAGHTTTTTRVAQSTYPTRPS